MASSLQTFKRYLIDASTQDKYAFTRNSRFRVRIIWPNGEPKTITDNNPFVSELANDIDYYVKSINIPNFKIGGRSLELDDLTDTDAVPGFSDLIIQNSLLLPQEMNFSIDFYDTEISFIDSAKGKTIEENLNKHEICSQCKGVGAESSSDIETCSTCKGVGQINKQRRTPFGVVNSADICHFCSGQGKIIKNKCKKCKGQKYTSRTVKTKITIPAGIKNGQEVIIEGFGGPGINGGPSGDLIIFVYVDQHKYFAREGNNVHIDFPISFSDILLEKEVKIPTPYGTEKIKLINDLESGDVITVKNKGFKIIGTSKYGDLKLHVKIFIPKLSRKEKEQLAHVIKDVKDDRFDV